MAKINLSSIVHFIAAIPAKLLHFVSNPKVEAAFTHIAADVIALLPYAIQAVQLVEASTGNRTVGEVSTILKKVGVVATLDPTTPAGDPTLKGLLLQAASAALHGNLLTAVANAGQAGLQLGEKKLTEPAHIPARSILDASVQIAYTFLMNGAGTTLLAAL